MARLLSPNEFGIIGMLAMFMAVAQTLIESGFGQALIQKRETSHAAECSVFYFNVLIAGAAFGVLWVAAPFIAQLFQMPVLVPVARVLALNLPINAFGLIQTTLLTRQLDFRTQVKAGLTANVVSGAIAITMAVLGYGVWSLVWQALIANLLRNALLWWLCSWQPTLAFSRAELGQLFRFGSRMLLSGIIDVTFRYIYEPVIGRLFSAGAVGQYSMANRITMMPTESLTSIISRVTFPLFSSVNHDVVRLKQLARRVLTLTMLVNMPITFGLFLTADNLVKAMLTEKWLQAVPYFQQLSIVALLLPLHSTNLNVLLSLGRSDINLRLETIKKALVLAAVFATYHWGVVGLIWGQIFVSLISCHINTYYTGKLIQYPLLEQLQDLGPILGVSALMATAVWSLNWVHFPGPFIFLVCQVTLGAGTFFLFCRIFHLRASAQLLAAITSLRSAKQTPGVDC